MNTKVSAIQPPPFRKRVVYYRERSWDLFTASVMLILGTAGIFAVYNWNSLEQLQGADQKSVIGSVTRDQGGLRYRPNQSPIWHDVPAAQSLSNGDTVFTANDGIAELQLSGSAGLTLSPNSLVVVQLPKKERDASGNWLADFRAKPATVAIQKGKVTLKIKQSAPTVQLVVANKTMQIMADAAKNAGQAESQLEIDVDPDDAEAPMRFETKQAETIKIVQQPVTAAATKVEPKAIELTAGKTVVIKKEGEAVIQPVSLTNIMPSDGLKLALEPKQIGAPLPVEFKWKATGDLQPEQKLVVEIRGTKDFDFTVKTNSTSHEALVPEGSYRWRVKAESTPKIAASSSSWSSFTVAALRPPTPIYPAEGAKLKLEELTGKSVQLSWEHLPEILKVEVQLKGKTGTKSLTVAANAGASFEAADGQYSWQARTVTQDGRTSAWTNNIGFTVKAEPRPAPILTTVTPSDGLKIAVESKMGSPLPIKLKWKTKGEFQPGQKIQIEIRGTKDFDFVAKTDDTTYETSLPEGNYRWRVRADGTPNIGPSSSASSSFSIAALRPPVPVSPLEGAKFKLEEIPGKNLPLSWEHLPEFFKVEVQLKGDNGKKSIMVRGASGATFDVADGQYSWRARTVTEDGRESDWTQDISFTVVEAAKPPIVLTNIEPLDGSKLVITPKNSGDPLPVELKWTASGEFLAGQKLSVEIKGTKDLELPAPTSKTSLETTLPEGTYRWRLKANSTAKIAASTSSFTSFTIAAPKPVVAALPQVTAPTVQTPSTPSPTTPPLPKLELKAINIHSGLVDKEILSANNADWRHLSIPISWKPLDGVKEYELSFLNENGTPHSTAKVKETNYSFIVKSLENLRYRYKIQAKLPTGETVKSGEYPITIELTAPVLTHPKDGAKFTREKTVLLTWSQTVLTEQYEIQIAKTEDFKTPLLKEKLTKNYFIYSDKPIGEYYWRVRSWNRRQTTDWTEPRSFRIKE